MSSDKNKILFFNKERKEARNKPNNIPTRPSHPLPFPYQAKPTSTRQSDACTHVLTHMHTRQKVNEIHSLLGLQYVLLYIMV